jgi:hypothetical protein
MSRRKEIEQRVNAATEGPWNCYPKGHCFAAAKRLTSEDCEFIAHARDDVPYLLEELRRRDEALKQMLAITHAFNCDDVGAARRLNRVFHLAEEALK